MSVTFDTTTRAAYEAATTATAKAAAVVSSLTGTVYVKVYNASNTAVGDGTMDSPWATSSGATITVGEVTEFEVTTTGTPDSGWYLRFENSDASRWVRASFGLSASSQDFKWSLGAWEGGQTGTIGTATIVCPGNEAPVFTVAPTSASVASTGGTIQFTATDPDGGTITYSLTTTRSGITINNTTGLVTVTAAAAGTSGNIVVQASDGILTASATCAVTVQEEVGGEVIYQETFTDRALGTIATSLYDGSTEMWRRNFNATNPPSSMVITDTDPLVGTSRYFRTVIEKDANTNYRAELTMLQYGRNAMTPITVGGVQNYYMPTDFWFGFRWRCDQFDTPPAGLEYVGGHLCQWHNDDSDAGLDSSKSPPLSLWLTSLGVRVRHEDNDDNGGSTAWSDYIIAAPFVGNVYDLMFRIRWDTRTVAQGTTGALDLYLNDGTTPVYIWRGQTCHPYPYTNGKAPYFRFGMYMGYWRDGFATMDGMVIGNSYDHWTLMGSDGSRLGVKPPLPRP